MNGALDIVSLAARKTDLRDENKFDYFTVFSLELTLLLPESVSTAATEEVEVAHNPTCCRRNCRHKFPDYLSTGRLSSGVYCKPLLSMSILVIFFGFINTIV
jgi:hypothetical protein